MYWLIKKLENRIKNIEIILFILCRWLLNNVIVNSIFLKLNYSNLTVYNE